MFAMDDGMMNMYIYVEHPGVVSVFLNKGRKLHTTHSWNFLSLEKDNGVIHSSSLWKRAGFGEDTIIGNLDTGKYYYLYIQYYMQFFFLIYIYVYMLIINILTLRLTNE